MCFRSLGYIVGASPPLCENMCVRLLGYTPDIPELQNGQKYQICAHFYQVMVRYNQAIPR